MEQKITFEVARKLIVELIADAPGFSDCDHGGIIISDDSTIERPWGWVFFTTTRQYQETGA